MEVEFHPEAVNEALNAEEWYARIDAVLGKSFLDDLELGVQKISGNPTRWSKHFHETRAYLLHRFPYLIIYRVINDIVQVVAVQHAKQRPEYWSDRI